MTRVLHLSTTDMKGGAARGAYWLHRALCESGIDSHMMVGRKYSDDDRVIEINGPLWRAGESVRGALDRLPLQRYSKTDDAFWTVGWVPRRLKRAVAAQKPDIVHLHWTGGGFVPIETLKTLPYPIVWTLRDMWAFTGGCHYTAGCTRYKDGCGKCPQLNSSSENDLSRQVWKRKVASWSGIDLWLVPISQWLADCTLQSRLFASAPVEVIPNGVDARLFHPRPREQARKAWGLDPDKRYILYGALGALQDKRKGFDALAGALRHFACHGGKKDTELLVFGNFEEDPEPLFGMKAHLMGHIEDDDRLAELYASADIMVVPSLQEAFGKTLIEAMACGTGVVAFDAGGPSEIVAHRETGYLARPFDTCDLAAGISWCLESPERVAEIGGNARRRVEKRFDLTQVAQDYLRLYRNILARVP